jgi:hypothetical protein
MSSARALAAVLVLVVAPAVASAQSDSQTAPASQGPMVVERIQNGFFVEPDVKVTRFDRRTSELVGASAGWVTDRTFFIGGGGYWLANPRDDRRLGYGGVVVQWLVGASDPIGFTVKGLFGGGLSRTTTSVTELVPARISLPQHPIDVDRFVPTTFRVRSERGFVIAEPEIDALVRISSRVRVTVGAGYRFTGADRRGPGVSDQLNGAVGTIGLQVGSKF